MAHLGHQSGLLAQVRRPINTPSGRGQTRDCSMTGLGIVVLVDGRLVESGAHAQLAAHEGVFWFLFLAHGPHRRV